jgi:hypothetical protein
VAAAVASVCAAAAAVAAAVASVAAVLAVPAAESAVTFTDANVVVMYVKRDGTDILYNSTTDF